MIPARIAENRIAATFLHVVLPTASLVILGSIFWIGFSGGGETTDGSSRGTGGATDVTYSAILEHGSELTVRADSAVMLKDNIHVFIIRGMLIQPDGHIRTLKASAAETTWNLDNADFTNGALMETAADGTEIEFSLQAGSVDFSRLTGHTVTAFLKNAFHDSIQSLVAKNLVFELETGFGELSGGATFTWQSNKGDNWLTVNSEGFRVKTRESEVESIGAAGFVFIGGNGRAGLLRITAPNEDTRGTVRLADGVEFTYLASRRPSD